MSQLAKLPAPAAKCAVGIRMLLEVLLELSTPLPGGKDAAAAQAQVQVFVVDAR